MASVSSNSKVHCHARSISLPSRSIQLSEFQEQLCTLQISESPTSSSLIGQQINGLSDAYSSVDSLLLLPMTQRSLSAQECQNNSVNELLDGLLKMLDMCSTAKNALSMTRNSTQVLQSVLRRKRGGDISGLMSAIQEYQSQRKSVKKAIHKALRESPKSGNKISSYSEVAATLKEVESVSSTDFESLFSLLHGSNRLRTSSNRWSLISKRMASKRFSCDEISGRFLVEKVDAELFSLISQKAKQTACIQVENTQKLLVEMESSFQDLEDGLECLSRHLIKTRVSLLNLLKC